MYQDPRFPVPRTNTTADDFWNQQMRLLVAGEVARLRMQADRETGEHPLLPVVTVPSDNREKTQPKQQRFSIKWLILCGLLILAFGLWGGHLFAPATITHSNTSSQSVTSSSSAAWLSEIPAIPNSWDHPCPSSVPQSSDPYAITGVPDVSVAFINNVLAYYHSPAAGLGQQLYEAAAACGIKDGVMLAFFMHESGLGTTGEARVTLSVGNSRCIPGYPCIDQDRGGYTKFPNWQTGFAVWARMMRNLYADQWGLITIDQEIPTYAPNTDHNNEQAYIASLKHILDTWRAGQIQV